MENIKDVEPQGYVDIFGDGALGQNQKQDNVADTGKVRFGAGGVDNDTNLFQDPPKDDDPNKDKPEEVVDDKKDDTTAADDKNKDVDILGNGIEADKTKGRKPKYDFSDASGYFENRVKEKKFAPIMQEAEDGTEQPFIPKNPEEFDEFINLQIEHQLGQRGKELEQRIYQSKSPAWQTVMKYAEMVDDPSEVIPFIQGIQNIESVANIDESDPNGAEAIVRARLSQRGEPRDVIDEQVEMLRGQDKLVSTAQKYKPIILQEEKRALALMAQEKKQQEAENEKIITGIRQGIVQTIEAPVFGTKKLTKEEKIAVYSLVGEPTEESGGYGIFPAIDSLFEKKDFATLTKLALFLAKEEAYNNYVSSQASTKTAADLQAKLRIAADNRQGGISTVDDDNQAPVIRRDSYKTKPVFGR